MTKFPGGVLDIAPSAKDENWPSPGKIVVIPVSFDPTIYFPGLIFSLIKAIR